MFSNHNGVNINPSLILRLGLGGVFIYAGISIITSYGRWVEFLPDWTSYIASNQNFLITYGIIQLAIGILLLTGFSLPITSFIAFLNLLLIMIFSGVGDTTFRDFGLSLALLALFVLNTKEGKRSD